MGGRVIWGVYYTDLPRLLSGLSALCVQALFLLALRHKVLFLAYVWSVVSVAPALNIVFWVGEFELFCWLHHCGTGACTGVIADG